MPNHKVDILIELMVHLMMKFMDSSVLWDFLFNQTTYVQINEVNVDVSQDMGQQCIEWDVKMLIVKMKLCLLF